MSVNIPKDSHSTDHHSLSSPSSPPAQKSQPTDSFQTINQDSVEVASKSELSKVSAAKEGAIPELKKPSPSNDSSILGAYRIYAEAMSAYQDQLGVSTQTDLEARNKFNRLAVAQAGELSKLIADKEAALERINEEIKKNLEELQKKIDEMLELAKKQQEAIDGINSGNGEEKKQYEELVRAYDDYVAKLKSIGAVDQGNGNFLIPDTPPEVKEKYNQITAEYQQAVSKFNDYWKGRSGAINKYNEAVTAYNQSVAEFNKAIHEFIIENNLSDFFKENGIPIPQLSPASRRNLSDYQHWIEAPSTIDTVPSTVFTYPPPTYARSIAQGGPPVLPNLPNFPHFNAQILYKGLYDNLYESEVASFDQAIIQYTSYWSFVARQTIQNLDEDLSSHALLNSKPLAQQLLFSSGTFSRQSSSSSGSLAMQALNLENPHLQSILGQALVKEIILHSNLKAVEELNGEEKEKKIAQLTDQVLILSVGLLGSQSLKALFPSLGMLSNHLASLPKDSPAFAILFAVSLSNRILEDVNQGVTAEALQTFLHATPELAALPVEDQAKLIASINLSQLLVVSKLLEDNLGLPGLVTQILPSLSSALNPHQMISQVKQENQQERLELHNRVKDQFVRQDYSKDQAQFLAQVAVELTQHGLLTPHLTSNISEKNLNRPLLENSVKAELVIARYSLQEAHTIAHEAVDRTLLDGPYSSTNQFRNALKSHLADFQVKNSPDIAIAAVLIPPTEESLLQFTVPSVQPTMESSPTAPATADAPILKILPAKLSPAELISILEKRALQLLVPQLGTLLAKQISQEIAKTLFGNPNPDSRDVAQIKSPYALVHVIRDQLYHLNIEQNQNWAKAVTHLFKETIKTMESFYAFSLKLMDPAYLFVFASGIIYGDQGKKKAIDIPI